MIEVFEHIFEHKLGLEHVTKAQWAMFIEIFFKATTAIFAGLIVLGFIEQMGEDS